MKFIDSHMHFWDQRNLPCTWLAEVPPIAGPHTFATLAAESPDLPEKIVFVEAGSPWLQEVQWVQAMARAEPRIAAIVAKVSINTGPDTDAQLAQLARHPLVRGVRHIFQDDPPDYCSHPDFIAGVRKLPAAGLSFDICCKHPHLPAVIALVGSCPKTRFILDHAGKPDIRNHLLDPWRSHIQTLATFPNIVCKFSGLVTEADHAAWSPDNLHPYLSHLLETFTPARLLFGGDWPVVKLASPYSRWLTTARNLLSHLPSADQQAIFHNNATRIYRL